MDESRSESRRLLRQLLALAGHKRAALAHEVHPAWFDALWKAAGWTSPVPLRARPSRVVGLLADAYGVRWPSMASMRQGIHRIALLNRRDVLRSLAVCALSARPDSLRVSIGREVRERLVASLGMDAYGVLTDAASPVGDATALAPDDLDLDTLAASGYRMLCLSGAWQCPDTLKLARILLAPDAVPAATPSVSEHAGAARAASAALRLHDFFPEFAWLFGSDMDRALSASTTG
jgi:hypothetical protein